MHAIHAECSSNTGVAEETVMKAMNGDFSDDPKLKQYLLCSGKKMGLINEAGEIQRNFVRATLMTMISDEAKVEEIIAKCAVKMSAPEETAYEASKCMHSVKRS